MFCVIGVGCPIDHWRCDSGQCILHFEYCDGYQHCDDGSDEPSGCSK